MENIRTKKYIINDFFSVKLPLLIYIAIVFNSVFSSFGIRYLYVPLILFSFVGFISQKNVRINSKTLIPFILIFLIFLLFYIQIFYVDNIVYSLQGLFLYCMFILYWSFYFSVFKIDNLDELIKKTIPIVYIISVLGIIQYFFSSTLYGFLNENLSKGILWASKQSFSEYVIYFRASSTLGSPQVYGLFIALYLPIVDYYQYKYKQLGLILLIISGILSGNKLFFLLLFVFLFYKIYHLSIYKKIFGIFGIILIGFLTVNSYTNIRVIERVFEINQVINQEKEDSRLLKYYNSFVDDDIFIGEGIGITSNTLQKERTVLESYFFQIRYEMGLIMFFIYILFFMGVLYLSLKNQRKHFSLIILMIFISMFIVHAFNSPVFFIFWSILISQFFINKKERLI